MQILYLYDINASDKKEFNRVKRVFYYRMKKLDLTRINFITKSTILIDKEYEIAIDGFFKEFNGKVKVYKALVENIERF